MYAVLMSDVKVVEEDETKLVISAKSVEDLYDYFGGFEDDVYQALSRLGDEGVVQFDDSDDNIVYLGEIRGKRFFPFEIRNSMFDNAVELMNREIKRYGTSESVKDKSRSRYIREKISAMMDDVSTMRPNDFTELHGYLYEVFTGGEIYTIRNKVEYYQTNNMLKAYDRFTVFAIIVEGTLHYDNYRKKGVPTLTNVACMKDEIFGELTKSEKCSKEYMRGTKHSMDDENGF